MNKEQRPIDIAGAGAGSLRLGALHHALEAVWIQAEHLIRWLHDDAELVVVLPTGDASTVSGRSDLDEEDRRLR